MSHEDVQPAHGYWLSRARSIVQRARRSSVGSIQLSENAERSARARGVARNVVTIRRRAGWRDYTM